MPVLLLRAAAALLLSVLSVPATAAGAVDPRQDEKTAIELRKQADKGNADAALQLGNLLARDRVAKTQYGSAVEWYKKGCALNSISACHNAGVSYHRGRNGAKLDYIEAANYYLQAADRAFLHSMFNLAILHADGKIASLDNREGLKWLLVAQRAASQCPDNPICKLVLQDPKGYRARLEAPLSANERQEARQLAEQWQPVR